MKPITLLWIMALLSACGGSLSNEQRQKMKEGMNQNKIVQMSDSDIMTAALEQGREIFETLKSTEFDPALIDSIGNRYRVKVRWTVPGSVHAGDMEQQLIEAYISGIATGSLQDNIQRLYTTSDPTTYDSLLYSRPVVSTSSEGVDDLKGIWNIYLSKKQIVLATASD